MDYCIGALILVKQQTRSDYTWSLHEVSKLNILLL